MEGSDGNEETAHNRGLRKVRPRGRRRRVKGFNSLKNGKLDILPMNLARPLTHFFVYHAVKTIMKLYLGHYDKFEIEIKKNQLSWYENA